MTDTRDYAALLLADTPMMDTRAPAEFERGSFPAAVNLPLMTDDERAQVGTCYKQKGQEAAIRLGHELVSGVIKQQRMEAWLAFAKKYPEGYLFCFRGGLRSQICQQWMCDSGVKYPRILGGYKGMRRFLIDTLEIQSRQREFIILGGNTGAAKTELLGELSRSIDLEGLAHHRGSAFGMRTDAQPSQINFENSLAIRLLKQSSLFPDASTILEDESQHIGQRYIPSALYESMTQSPLVLIEASLSARVEHTFQNYILDALYERQQRYGEFEGFRLFSEYLIQALRRIRRRLGGARHAELEQRMQQALTEHGSGDNALHRTWIESLLRDYYDPMYTYQIQQKEQRVIFRGGYAEVLQFLQACHKS